MLASCNGKNTKTHTGENQSMAKEATWHLHEDRPSRPGEIVRIKDKPGLHMLFMTEYGNSRKSLDLTTFEGGSIKVKEYQLIDRSEVIDLLVAKAKTDPEVLEFLVTSGPQVGSCGGDPELFITTQDGVLVPAFDHLPMVGKTTSRLFADGFASEMNLEPSGCLSYVVDSAHRHMDRLYDLLTSRGHTVTGQNVFEIPQDIMGKATDEQVALGCNPTFNLYGLKPDLRTPRRQVLRSAGGHLHFDLSHIPTGQHKTDFRKLTKETRAIVENSVRGLDSILGVACVSLFEKFDDPRRRLSYGQAGEYRTPTYGVEYRTLSNAWMRHPVLMHMIYDLGRAAITFGIMNLPELIDGTEQEVVQIIQDCDATAARAYMTRNENLFKTIMSATHLTGVDRYDKIKGLDASLAFNKFYHGAHTFIADPDDLWKNWKVGDREDEWASHSEGHNCSWYRAQYDLQHGVAI